MPIPYLGSKRGSARKIVNLIKAYCPNASQFFDVFCGGLAISEAAQKVGYEVFASDLDTNIVALANEVMFGKCIDRETGVSIFEKPRFITRKEFNLALDKVQPSWWRGYLQSVWTYGNGGKSYLYGYEMEAVKRKLHSVVVDGELSNLNCLSFNRQQAILKFEDWKTRRIVLGKVNKKRDYGIQHLERLERLEHPVVCSSYEKVNIPKGAVIYCDPPYVGTAKYQANKLNGFDHKRFYEWCREKAQTNPIFISEYWMPNDFRAIYQFKRRQTLSVDSKKQAPDEKVYFLDLRKIGD